MISIFHKYYPQDFIAMLPPKNSAPSMVKPIAKRVVKPLKATKRKYEKTSMPASKQIREA